MATSDAPVALVQGGPCTVGYPWLLPTVVAVAAMLIGLFLASLVRQLRGRLRPPE